MTIQGKGFYIWKILETELGDTQLVADIAAQSNYTHLMVKIADGDHTYNVDPISGADLVPPLLDALKSQDIQRWGWHFVYGYDPVAEADIAIRRINQLDLDGYVIDAESDYKLPGRATAARTFMDRLRKALPNFPIALSSYRYPSYHPQLPWSEFLQKCDYNMPQVYWLQNHNPAEQLIRSVREFEALEPFRPIIPTGAAFKESGWYSTPQDVVEFLETAQSLNLSAANFWEWSNCRLYLPEVWKAIKNYQWATAPAPLDISEQYIQALNSHDPDKVAGLYTQTAVHVTAARTVQGLPALKTWFQSFFKEILPAATFGLTGFSGSGSTRHFTWTAVSSAGAVNNGSDTLGLVDGKIAYHYSFFTVS